MLMIPVKLEDMQSEQDLSHLSKQELNCFVCGKIIVGYEITHSNQGEKTSVCQQNKHTGMIQLQAAEMPAAFRSGKMQRFAHTVRKQKLHLQALLPDNPQSQNMSQAE